MKWIESGEDSNWSWLRWLAISCGRQRVVVGGGIARADGNSTVFDELKRIGRLREARREVGAGYRDCVAFGL